MGATKEQQKAILRGCGRYIRKQLAPIQKQLEELQRKDMSGRFVPAERSHGNAGFRNHGVKTLYPNGREVVVDDNGGVKSRYRYDPSAGTWTLVGHT